MEKILLNDIKNYSMHLDSVRNRQKKRYREISMYSKIRLKPIAYKCNHVYYCGLYPGQTKARYIGNELNSEVMLICEARYLEKSLSVIDEDIKNIRDFLEKYKSVSFGGINNMLPMTYRRDVMRTEIRNEAARKWKEQAEAYKATFEEYKPEEKIHTTLDGTKVRSKSEMAIYNYLLENGYTFVYELPLRTNGRTFYPDFTILSEIDYKTEVRIEHQGMYGDSGYRDRSEAREYDYWKNGFLPARDIYFTFDDNKGGLDLGPVIEILKSRVRL